MNDSKFMSEALLLASKGVGWANPNPMVGAVVVKNGKIIGRGYHKKVGGLHAETEAIANAPADITGATMYVTLEPHSYVGRTPPCVDAIIKSGITKVVCSTLDPNPLVSGSGIKALEQAGVSSVIGPGDEEARALNEAFFTFHQKRRPFVAIKFAASLDGKIATVKGDSKWITNGESREFARKLRGKYQAILVGVNTVLADDPHLGSRDTNLPDPVRIILDSKLQTPLDSKVLRDTNVIIATTSKASKIKIKKLEQKGVTILTFDSASIPITELLGQLKDRDIISVFVEGGAKTLGSFVSEKLVDKVYAFYGPLLIGGDKALSVLSGVGHETTEQSLHLEKIKVKQFKNDVLITGYILDSRRTSPSSDPAKLPTRSFSSVDESTDSPFSDKTPSELVKSESADAAILRKSNTKEAKK